MLRRCFNLLRAKNHLTPAGDLSKSPFLKFWNRDCGRDDLRDYSNRINDDRLEHF